MKAQLIYNLADEDDKYAYKNAMNGSKYLSTLEDLDNYLRAKIKYEVKLTEAQVDIYQEIRTKLNELRQEYEGEE